MITMGAEITKNINTKSLRMHMGGDGAWGTGVGVGVRGRFKTIGRRT